ncbi:hypothetical protein DM47_3601 [Burkholderia mallei]|nr:hypothetical protein DM47_3601 [Burkholderia mallei]
MRRHERRRQLVNEEAEIADDAEIDFAQERERAALA